MTKVAVITRTRNRPLLLRRCILSVLNQSFSDWLHVIVNDGGDPLAVNDVVAGFSDRYQGRVKIIHNENSVGMQNASNLAIRSCESKYVAIHDDDDSWNRLFLAECVSCLDAAGPDAPEQGVAVQSWWILEEIDSVGNVVELSRRDFLPFESVSLFQTAARNAFPPIAFLYRRRVHDAIGYFDQTFNELGDHDFNLRFLSRYEIAVLPKKLAGYHWRHQSHGNSYGNTVTDALPAHRRQLVKLQNHYLRQDLNSQKIGLGFLLNIANRLENQNAALQNLAEDSQRGLNKINRKIIHYERLLGSIFTPWRGKFYLRRFYDLIADFFDAKKSAAENQPQNGFPDLPLAREIVKSTAVSLDIFDTALLRLVRQPADVFLYIQNDVRRLLNRPGLNFVAARVTAEEQSRRDQQRLRSTTETTLDEIYSVLQSRLECDAATAAKIKNWELQAERALCYANPEIVRLLTQMATEKKTFVWSSDMYLPAATVLGLLKQNGFPDAPLFLSSEISASKHEGGLFDHLLAKLKCPPAELIHIGDNSHSDVANPRAKGIHAHHWIRTPSQTPLVDQRPSYSGAWENDLASSLYTGLVRRRRLTHPPGDASAFWKTIGYEIVGPLHHAFLGWVTARASQMGLKKLFFLARDGCQLVKGFELFRKHYGLEMEGQYTFASRRLWNFAGIERLDSDSLAFLLTPNPCLRVRDFFARISPELVPRENIARQFGFKNLDERITTPTGVFRSETQHQNLRRLLCECEPQIVGLAARERKVLLAYFADIGLLNDRVGLVDIGWAASSSQSLQKLLAAAGKSAPVPGFYFATWSHAAAAVEAGCPIESFFTDLGEPKHRFDLLTESVELVETFFSAPHPTVVGVARHDGQWTPQYGDREVDAPTEANLETAAASALDFIRDALGIWPQTPVTPPFGYLETVLERLLRHPTKSEAATFGKFAWRNTFGGSGPLRQLATPPAAWTRLSRRDGLQDTYDHSCWKKGFLAQLSARARKYITP
jgi:glycosyltransferase involved in cell wall biosynthesis